MKKLFEMNFFEGNQELLMKKISDSSKAIIFTPNIDHIIKLDSDNELYEKYSKANFIIADGWPIAITGKLKKININRITGVDIVDDLLKEANTKRMNIFFFGAEDSTLLKLKDNIKGKYKDIGSIETNNGFFYDNEVIINKINNNKTDILFVGMGCPKQEKWIVDNCNKLDCKVMIGVGGAFKVYSGEVSRAPKIVQTLGAEWFYRFIKEPKRLFKRYFVEYFKFIPIFLNEIFISKGETYD